ncbi:MAG TPA: MBL fold metallo-hydrolase [Candidatus Micrarchaeia archaeon]|nr:MBL fold metallo-hydrolase [Candidatus Micrarchaeia archaeon]
MARLDLLAIGYARDESDDVSRVGSTIVLVRAGAAVVVVDPGMTADRAALLASLAAQGCSAADVTDVVCSHQHLDHTMNVALFPAARVHDHAAEYQGDRWLARPAEGLVLAPGVTLLATPGHTAEDLTTLVETADGPVACTHLWWSAAGPADDPYAPDRAQLRRQRERVLALTARIVPGHGAPFTAVAATPR